MKEYSIIPGIVSGIAIAVGCKIFGASNLFVWCSYWVGLAIEDFCQLLRLRIK